LTNGAANPESYLSANQEDLQQKINSAWVQPFTSGMCVGLQVHGELLGEMLFLTSNRARPYEKFDLCLAEEIAHLAALAIDNARLYADAQNAIQMRQELLAIVSHELRNSLTSILLSAQMMNDPRLHLNEESPIKKCCQRILTSGKQMQRLILDLLDQAKLESKTFSLKIARHRACEYLRRVVETLDPLAQAANVQLRIEQTVEDAEIDFDEDRITQVISNLFNNALKFSPRETEVIVGLTHLKDEILFFVKDQGIGINREDLTHLFERFWQSEKNSKVGTGLGLSIAKEIVEAHHGKIWAESTVGLGTSFYFTLPAA
jgi:signal transduction histidine kinase